MRRIVYLPVKVAQMAAKEKNGKEVQEKKMLALPDDWPFMEESGKILDNMPETWKQYPLNPAGKAAIIDMEYKEMVAAITKEDKKHELVHLASACLNLWRELNAE